MIDTNPDFIEKLIFKGMFENKNYNSLINNALDKKFFESDDAGILFNSISEYFREYKEIPTIDIITNIVPEENKTKIIEYIQEINAIDVNIANNMQFLINETDNWLKEKALIHAIYDSAELINKNKRDEYSNISTLIKSALTKTIKFDIGTNYFETLGERLHKIFNSKNEVVSTGYPSWDQLMSGGFPKDTLSVFFGRTHRK